MPLGEASKGNVLAYIPSEGKTCLVVCTEPRNLRLHGLCVDQVQDLQTCSISLAAISLHSLQSCWPKQGQSETSFISFLENGNGTLKKKHLFWPFGRTVLETRNSLIFEEEVQCHNVKHLDATVIYCYRGSMIMGCWI